MSLLDRLRRPAYTGENRCLPCTALNGALVIAAAAAVGRRRRAAGVATLAGGAAAIGLRGYVLPFTPRVAPRLAAALPVDLPHPGSDARTGTGAGADADADSDPGGLADPTEEGDAVLADLLAAGVIREDDAGALDLAPWFREAWEARAAALAAAGDETVAAAVADAAPFDATGEVRDGTVVLRGGTWTPRLVRPVAVAEAAAVETLAEAGVPAERRPDAAYPLRTFLTACPDCGGDVVETTRRDCCGPGAGGTPEREVLACADCDVLYYQFPERSPRADADAEATEGGGGTESDADAETDRDRNRDA